MSGPGRSPIWIVRRSDGGIGTADRAGATGRLGYALGRRPSQDRARPPAARPAVRERLGHGPRLGARPAGSRGPGPRHPRIALEARPVARLGEGVALALHRAELLKGLVARAARLVGLGNGGVARRQRGVALGRGGVALVAQAVGLLGGGLLGQGDRRARLLELRLEGADLRVLGPQALAQLLGRLRVRGACPLQLFAHPLHLGQRGGKLGLEDRAAGPAGREAVGRRSRPAPRLAPRSRPAPAAARRGPGSR